VKITMFCDECHSYHYIDICEVDFGDPSAPNGFVRAVNHINLKDCVWNLKEKVREICLFLERTTVQQQEMGKVVSNLAENHNRLLQSLSFDVYPYRHTHLIAPNADFPIIERWRAP